MFSTDYQLTDNRITPLHVTSTVSDVPRQVTPTVSGVPRQVTPTVSGIPKQVTPTVSGVPRQVTPTVSDVPRQVTPPFIGPEWTNHRQNPISTVVRGRLNWSYQNARKLQTDCTVQLTPQPPNN